MGRISVHLIHVCSPWFKGISNYLKKKKLEVLVVSQVGHGKRLFLIVLTSVAPERMGETVTKIFQAW